MEADHTNSFDAGGRVGRGGLPRATAAAGRGFDDGERGLDEFAEAPRCLREHLAEQLRLGFPDRVDLLIGAHLIALLDPAAG